VAVLLTNADLARQLLSATEERIISDQKLGESLSALEMMNVKIAALEDSLEKKKMEAILLMDSARIHEKEMGAREVDIARLEADVAALRGGIAQAEARLAESLLKLDLAGQENEKRIASLVKSHQRQMELAEDERKRTITLLTSEADKRLKEIGGRVDSLQAVLNAEKLTVAAMRSREEKLELALARQRSHYTALEEKYNQLIGPARSALDKEVVSVRFSREGGEYIYLFKDAGSDKYESISEKELHRRLERLKQRLGKSLYVKIIIPEGSNLSYNEAWTFTNTILTRYDYYYQRD